MCMERLWFFKCHILRHGVSFWDSETKAWQIIYWPILHNDYEVVCGEENYIKKHQTKWGGCNPITNKYI